MTILLYFILGIAFYGLAMPILESIVSLIVTWFEYLKGKITLKMVQMQEKADKMSAPPEHAIGFEWFPDVEEEEEEWEDDE